VGEARTFFGGTMAMASFCGTEMWLFLLSPLSLFIDIRNCEQIDVRNSKTAIIIGAGRINRAAGKRDRRRTLTMVGAWIVEPP
jgi:hypothetical protein